VLRAFLGFENVITTSLPLKDFMACKTKFLLRLNIPLTIDVVISIFILVLNQILELKVVTF
jgi:hypothetical protein